MSFFLVYEQVFWISTFWIHLKILAVYHNVLELKLNKEYELKVQTFSFFLACSCLSASEAQHAQLD